MKNKELGREDLFGKLGAMYSYAIPQMIKKGISKEIIKEFTQASLQLRKLIQQSGEKPEIDKKYMKKKAEAMHFYMGLPAGVCLPICEEFVSEIISEVQKPEIDEEWLEMKAKMFTALAYKLTQHEPHIENHHFNKLQAKDFIRQIVAEVRKVKTIQVGEVLFGKEEHEKQMARVRDDLLDGIIDTVLEHADCHHTVDHDEDGTHCSSEYDIDSEEKVKEKLRKILNKGGD